MLGTVLGFALGIVVAVLRLSHSPFLRAVGWTYVWAFRSIPLIVQLLFWFNIFYLYQRLSVGIPFGPEYAEVLKRWGLSDEAVPTSEINPPGLPKT